MSKGEVSELLKPRIKCIANDTSGDFEAGDIFIHPEKWEERYWKNFRNGRIIVEPKKYPHLFRELKWYEEREASEMPEYVKSLINQEFYKVVEKNEVSFKAVQEWRGGWGIDYPWSNIVPATETEYQQYLKPKPRSNERDRDTESNRTGSKQ